MSKLIVVPNIGQRPVSEEAKGVPRDMGNAFEYEVTDEQAMRWESLTEAERIKLVKDAEDQRKDLRQIL